MAKQEILWRPHKGKQTEALRSNEFEVLYGGARGCGKTDAGIAWLARDIKHPKLRALVIRRNSSDLSDWIDRANTLYSSIGTKGEYVGGEFRFPSGAKFRLGHLKDQQAYTKYLGHEYHRILIEELTLIPFEKDYLKLISACRSVTKELPPKVFCTTNPGNPGHAWVKQRFVDPAPPMTPFRDKTSGRTRIFIPATIDDNPALAEADPDHVKFLDSLKDTDPELWKAWRYGSWDVFVGQFFKTFRRDLHSCKVFTPEEGLTHIGGMDWGRTAPFVFLASVAQKTKTEGGANFTRVWTYQEVDGTEKTPKEWAKIIKERVNIKNFSWIRGDPSMFTKGQDTSVSIADQFKKEGIKIRPASNDRIGGWTVMVDWLSIAPDGLPYWLITENCHNLITTLPQLVHDDNRVEDVDTDGPDHWADAARYMFKHLKWIDAKPGAVPRLRRVERYKRAPPTDKYGNILSIDIDKFAVPSKKQRGWQYK